MTYVADEHQGAAFESKRRTIRRDVSAVSIEATDDNFIALGNLFNEIAFHEAEPIAIDHDLIFRVHSGDGIFAIHNRGQRRFQNDIGNSGGIRRADWRRAVDDDLTVHAVFDEHNRGRRGGIALVADKLRRVCEAGLACGISNQKQIVDSCQLFDRTPVTSC